MTQGYTEAEGYAASLRQMADWVTEGRHADVDESELYAAADLIERLSAVTVDGDSWRDRAEAAELMVSKLTLDLKLMSAEISEYKQSLDKLGEFHDTEIERRAAAEARVKELSPATVKQEALAKFLCEEIAAEPFDDLSRPKYMADADALLARYRITDPVGGT